MDFRTFVEQLAAEDNLLRIRQEVDPEYELGALLQQAEAHDKAIWFEQVKGSGFPVVGSVMNTAERHALSISKSPRQMSQPGAWAGLFAEAGHNPLTAVETDGGPAAETILTGDNIDLNRLPVPFSFPGDTHRFMTAGLGIVMDPEHQQQNVGFYRAPVIDGQHLSISAGVSSRLKQIYSAAASFGQKMPLAFVIGAPPALLLTAGYRIGREENDLAIAGALQGKPLELMRCQTSDLLVPAMAEFVIEVEVELDKLLDHTMGEFPDNYGATTSPVARVTAITHRADAVYHTILGGMNREHNALGAYIFTGLRERLLEQLQPAYPGLNDIHVDLTPRRMGGRCQISVALDKSAEEEPQQLIEAIYAQQFDTFPLAMVVQRVVIADPDVDIRSNEDIEWAIAMRADSSDKLRVIEVPAKGGGTTTRLAIDTTVAISDRQKTRRPRIPGAADYPLDRYL